MSDRYVAGQIDFQVTVDDEFYSIRVEILDKQNVSLSTKWIHASPETIQQNLKTPGEYRLKFQYQKDTKSEKIVWFEGMFIIYIQIVTLFL